MEPLGKNLGRYFGETINIRSVLKDVESAARKHGWAEEIYFETKNFKYPALRRRGEGPFEGPSKNIYISSGIHGDEPAGPLAMLELLQRNEWPTDVNIWICPCLNAEGFTLDTRENKNKVDLNRDYKNPKTAEVKAHVTWLEKQPEFDVSICLHEDWEAKGFYIYRNKDRSPLAEKIVKKVEKVFPIDLSATIEGISAKDGIVTLDFDITEQPDWRESSYLIKKEKGQHYTLETSSDFPLQARVNALVTAVREVLDLFCAR